MNFFESISEMLGLDDVLGETGFKAVIGDRFAYFENVRGIKSYSPEEIVLSLKKGGVILSGENLYVKKYCMGDVAVCGKIIKTERV